LGFDKLATIVDRKEDYDLSVKLFSTEIIKRLGQRLALFHLLGTVCMTTRRCGMSWVKLMSM
jgi:hypothetical protein